MRLGSEQKTGDSTGEQADSREQSVVVFGHVGAELAVTATVVRRDDDDGEREG